MTRTEQLTIWTIGHSTRSIEEFLSLLSAHRIQLLIDVRRFPVSRRYSQFNEASLKTSLAESNIEYLWLPELGGRRTPRRDSPNTAWRNAGFRGYADHMTTREFREGFERVVDAAKSSRAAIMCAEAVWWKCHRGLVSDALVVEGFRVVHIMAAENDAEHPMTGAATVVDGKLTYSEKEQTELL